MFSSCCFLAHIIYLSLRGQEAGWEMNEQQSGGRRRLDNDAVLSVPAPGPCRMKAQAGGPTAAASGSELTVLACAPQGCRSPTQIRRRHSRLVQRRLTGGESFHMWSEISTLLSLQLL